MKRLNSALITRFLAVMIVWCLGQTAHAAPQLYFIHNGHLGTPQAVTDQNQQIVWRARHKPFGEATEEVSAIEQNARFPGQYLDEETGYHYNYFRDYDPGIGRYLQSDPIGLVGGLNTYGYAYQNPIRYTDPTGQAVPAVVAACAANVACVAAIAGAAFAVSQSAGNIADVIGNAIDHASSDESQQCKNEDNCDVLYKRINTLVNELKRRYHQLIENQKNLPATGPFSVAGHQQQFRNKQTQLRNLLNLANSKGCTGYNSEAWTWATTSESSLGRR